MPPIPIDPYEDERVTHEFAILNGRRYHYVQGFPKHQKPRATILCLHGFPDLWYGWRYIIPGLLDMGLRVIVPDMIGYGQTDAPRVPPNNIQAYSWKQTADDMAELLKQLNIPRVILLGHDWGGVIVYRIYFWHRELVTHIVSISTSYRPPTTKNLPLEDIVKMIPTFTYQIAFADPQTEKDMQGLEAIGRFMRAVHRGRGDPGTGTLQVRKDLMKALGDQPIPKLWTKKDYNYYLEEYGRNGMHGPLNWYKLTEQAYQEEKNLNITKIEVPVMFVGGTRDIATPARMGATQGKYIPNLILKELNASHWIPVECPDELLGFLKEFVENVVFAGGHKAHL